LDHSWGAVGQGFRTRRGPLLLGSAGGSFAPACPKSYAGDASIHSAAKKLLQLNDFNRSDAID
jgi:hypothetical protein